MLVRKPSK